MLLFVNIFYFFICLWNKVWKFVLTINYLNVLLTWTFESSLFPWHRVECFGNRKLSIVIIVEFIKDKRTSKSWRFSTLKSLQGNRSFLRFLNFMLRPSWSKHAQFGSAIKIRLFLIDDFLPNHSVISHHINNNFDRISVRMRRFILLLYLISLFIVDLFDLNTGIYSSSPTH